MTQNNLFIQTLVYPEKITCLDDLKKAIEIATIEATSQASKGVERKGIEKKIRGYIAHIIFKRYFPEIHSFNYWHHRYQGLDNTIDYHSTTCSWKRKSYRSIDGHASLEQFLTEIIKLVPCDQ
jgi:hypothetical protein